MKGLNLVLWLSALLLPACSAESTGSSRRATGGAGALAEVTGSNGVLAGSSGGADGNGGAAKAGASAGGPIPHHVMVMEYPGRLVEISAEGQLLWEHRAPSLSLMFTMLENGNVFFPHGGDQPGAQEVDRQHNIVWSYTSVAGELLGGERLANGNSLLGEGGPARVVELSPSKQLVRSVPITTKETDPHRQIRHVHRLNNGNVLVALEGEGAVREFDANGTAVWAYEGLASVHDAIRLPNGNTLIGGGQSKRVVEVTPQQEVVWEFGEQDAPGLGLNWITSIQVLKTGNLLVCNWLGEGGGAGVHAFEVTRDKRVVWMLEGRGLFTSATTVWALDGGRR